MVREALEALDITPEDIKIDRPADASHGDFMTNAALVYGKKTGVSSRDLAGKLVAELLHVPAEEIDRIEVAGPGFINFFLTDAALAGAVTDAVQFAESGQGTLRDERVNIEFISTNPTGELHIGHGRSAFYGDVLARVLLHTGAEVTREFYINDSRESNQIRELGKTALGKGEQYKTPELEEKISSLNFEGLSEEEAGGRLAEAVQEGNRAFIEGVLGVHFDVWYSEDAELRATGANDTILARLKQENFTYEKDGALWLKTAEYGDDEDRVIVRSDGTKTYFIADIAYHDGKFARGFQVAIDVWGADHHGHVKRMQSVGRMLGWPNVPRTGADQPVIFIVQLVSLKEDGKEGKQTKKMSKRAGNVILLRDLVEEFGIDVVRWFFAEKALSTQMAFDMALARDASENNPVFYVQYAHARLNSILEKTQGLKEVTRTTSLFEVPSARTLAAKMTEFPELVESVATDYSVHALTGYATGLATAVNTFYRDVRIVTGDMYDANALALAMQAKGILKKTLDILGISAPEKM
ncbi:MAG: Arginine-tRNA ligase [Parcubacteria group bacterium GW2011_GWA1_47_8]|nr:MAG: Arginine-tRNA ligase [Parcubacteria group bacterium GW2011_GWA1_47_8]KKW07970.1 MAG: Arginine-tRNA ligase [Parcubacteria group bacterium GW2011_GWA2_49_16]